MEGATKHSHLEVVLTMSCRLFSLWLIMVNLIPDISTFTLIPKKPSTWTAFRKHSWKVSDPKNIAEPHTLNTEPYLFALNWTPPPPDAFQAFIFSRFPVKRWTSRSWRTDDKTDSPFQLRARSSWLECLQLKEAGWDKLWPRGHMQPC